MSFLVILCGLIGFWGFFGPVVHNGDGSRVETTTDTGYNGTLLDEIIATASADGKTTTTTIDRNGDGRTATDIVRQKGPVDFFELRAHRAVLRGARVIDPNTVKQIAVNATNDNAPPKSKAKAA